MSGPKLTRIMDEIVARVQTITVANGYTSDIGERVFVDNRNPQDTEVPCAMVSFTQRTGESTVSCAAKTTMTITVTGYLVLDDAIGYQIAFDLLGDIQRAVETDDNTIGNLLMGAEYGLTFASEGVGFPDAGGNVIAATTTYNAPSMRLYGDPEIV